MQFSITTILLFAGIATAAIVDVENVRNLPRDPVLTTRQNGGRPVPNGNCCVANTSLKQDSCTTPSGAAGRCVPGGQACGSRLSCVAQANLGCDNNVIERGKSLCRARVGNGFQDGAQVISNLNQAKVN